MKLGTLQVAAFKGRFNIKAKWHFQYKDGIFSQGTVDNNNDAALEALLIANPQIKKSDFEDLATDTGISRTKTRGFVEARIASKAIQTVVGSHNTQRLTWAS